MKQSRLMSLVEAIANVVVGYGIAVLTQLVVFPWFGLPARVGDALAIGAVFTSGQPGQGIRAPAAVRGGPRPSFEAGTIGAGELRVGSR